MSFKIYTSTLLVLALTSAYGSLEAEQMQTAIGRWTQKSRCSEQADCPPWAECNNSYCVCLNQLQNFNTVQCDKYTLELSVIKCHCVTFDSESGELVEGSCIENCQNERQYMPLPLNVSQLNHFMCEEKWNRTGRLCGRCLPGHSPLAYSYDMRCVKCSEGNRNIWKYILVAFGPLTVFYFLIVFLKINVTSSYLHGYLIYSQLLSTPVLLRKTVLFEQDHPEWKIPIRIITTVYSIWNLDFFRGVYPDICLDVSTLTVLALDYAVAIYPLLLTVVSYILIKLHGRNFRLVVILWRPFRRIFTLVRRNWDSRTTVIDAYATFFMLSYNKFLWVSGDLLTPLRAHSINNESDKWVLYIDATVDYFGYEHIPYAILAIVVCMVLTLIPTLFLIFYQIKWFQKLLCYLKIRSQLIQALMDSFQGCYKNGTEIGTRDYRWFAAVPLIGRIGLHVTYAVNQDNNTLPYLMMGIIFIIVLTVIIQPYKTELSKYTKIDIIFWAFLASFLGLDEAVNYPNLKSVTQVRVATVIRVVEVVIPFLCMCYVAGYWIFTRMRKMNKFITRAKAWRRGYVNIEDDSEASLPDRLVNPKNYEGEKLQDPISSLTGNSSYQGDTY